MKMPTTLGATIDALWKIIEERKALSAADKALSEKEQILRDHLQNNFDKSGLGGAKGKLAAVSLKTQTVADVQDWDKFYAYIAKNKAWECLQKRPGITALRERWDAGKEVPGVSSKEITVLSVTAVSK